MPRVLLVTPGYPPALGGVERVVGELATRLGAVGWSVEVATTSHPGSRAGTTRDGHVSVRRFGTLPGGGAFAMSPRLAVWLLRSAGRFDVIHAHSYHTPVALVAALAATWHQVPFILTLHYHGTGHTAARRLLHRPYKAAGAWMVQRARVVICNSVAEQDLVRNDFGKSLVTEVIYHGISIQTMSTGAGSSSSADGFVLTGGRLEAYKQVEVIVRALGHMPLGQHLVVFGEGPDRERLEDIARSTGVAQSVQFTGRVSDTALVEYFRTARVFVSMSRKESFGLTVVEAAAAGTRVVASSIPAYREVASLLPDDAVRFVDVDADPATVADAIVAAAAEPRSGPPDPSTLPTWDSMAAGVAAIYQRVLPTGAGHATPSWAGHPLERIHVTGGSGTGKSVLARSLADRLEAPVHHLDDVAREPGSGRVRSDAERAKAVEDILAAPRWVTEGIHTGWTDPLCERADLIVWLDHLSTGTRIRRVLRRFVAGGVSETRHQRGVRRFFRPASYKRHLRDLAQSLGEIRAYRSAEPGPERDAGSHAATAAQLAPFMHKVVHCRSRQDIDDVSVAVDRAARVAATPGERRPTTNE